MEEEGCHWLVCRRAYTLDGFPPYSVGCGVLRTLLHCGRHHHALVEIASTRVDCSQIRSRFDFQCHIVSLFSLHRSEDRRNLSQKCPKLKQVAPLVVIRHQTMEDGRFVEERTFCFGTLSVAILGSMWLFGRDLSVEDVYISVGTAFLYAVTIPVTSPESVFYAALFSLLPMCLVSPIYLLDWNTMWQKWPNATVLGLLIGYVAFWMHHFANNRRRYKWKSDREYDRSFLEVDKLSTPIGAEE